MDVSKCVSDRVSMIHTITGKEQVGSLFQNCGTVIKNFNAQSLDIFLFITKA